MDSLKKDFEVFLKNHFQTSFFFPKGKGALTLKRALSYCLFSPASRFRPRLCFATAKFFERNPKEAFPLAGAIEMIHCGSLAQDDLPVMDNSKTRRGQPACHVVFGEDMALLAGSCLFVEAFSLLNQMELPLSKTRQLLKLFTKKAGFQGIMGGQALDIHRNFSSKKNLLTLYRLKTGALIEMAVEGPATLWGKKKENLCLSQFAQALGVAYQIADNLQDKEFNSLSSKKELKHFTGKVLLSLKPLGERTEALRELTLLNKQRGLS